jgi:hypothetical protein
MCGRVIQSSGPLRYAIVDGINMRMWPISTRVNKPENDDPSIIEPIESATDAAEAGTFRA